jgi:hypothetical protein
MSLIDDLEIVVFYVPMRPCLRTVVCDSGMKGATVESNFTGACVCACTRITSKTKSLKPQALSKHVQIYLVRIQIAECRYEPRHSSQTQTC